MNTIVVASYRGSPWLQQCLDSIPSKFSTIVVRNGGYECGALRWVVQNTNLEKFLFLQDSTRINDCSWIDDAFAFDGSVSLNCDPGWFGSFLGIYRRQILSKCFIPLTPDKMSAIAAESALGLDYKSRETNRKILWPDLTLENARLETVANREVMVYENEFFTKFKSCYSESTIEACIKRDQFHKTMYP